MAWRCCNPGFATSEPKQVDAGLRALAHAARHPIAGRGVVFQNMLIATAYNLARDRLGTSASFARVRGALEQRLRDMRLVVFGSGRPYYNWYLVEALAVLELLRSGVRSTRVGRILADRAVASHKVMDLLARVLPDVAGRYRRSVNGRRTVVLSDPPWNPLAYHAFSMGLLARAVAILGPRAPEAATSLLLDGTQAAVTYVAPDGALTHVGRSQEQSWTLAMTAYAAEMARTRATAAVAAQRSDVIERVIDRLRREHTGGPFGLYVTPALRRSVAAGVRGLDAYTSGVAYTGLTLIGLNWLLETRATNPAGSEGTPDRQGARQALVPLASGARTVLLGGGRSTLAVGRAADVWFAVQEKPGVRVAGRPDHSKDLRYDFGLVALQSRQPDGSWRSVVRPRPRTSHRDSAGPVVVGEDGVRYFPTGARLRIGPDGSVFTKIGFRDRRGRVLSGTMAARYEPVACGVRVWLRGELRRRDRVELSAFLRPKAARAGVGAVIDTVQRVAFDRRADVRLEPGYASGLDSRLVRARVTFAPGVGRLTLRIEDRACRERW